MTRILGVNIPDNKQSVIGLTYIHGIGNSLSKKILKIADIKYDKKARELSGQELEKIKNVIEKNFKIEGDLHMEVSQNIKRLKEINCYRGSRHTKKLPVRGQRTKTNARTKRGRRMCVGSGRKAAAEKT